ncbi:response regulator [Kribbella sp. NBC_00382]|uniref:response regulator n=1 Tax=Kribbella sp. NBC_00382 TaxID=2975967 RepID=UPI002E2160C7
MNVSGAESFDQDPKLGDGRPSGEVLSARVLFGGSGGALAVGAVAAIFVAAGSGASWSEGLRWSLYMIASGVIAVIVGLIFGVPRARSEFVAGASERYSSNSNLEQISDWLTKLLVGAGLVQLASAPGRLAKLGDYLGSGLEVPSSAAYSLAAVVYGAGVGFTCGYLWTRLRMRIYLEAAEVQAAYASKQRALASIVQTQNQVNEQSEPRRDVDRAVQRALEARKAVGGRRIAPILWVDDVPSNNTALIAALNTLDIEVQLADSTAKAMELIGQRNYGLVISDLGRQEGDHYNDRAGIDLLDQIRARDTTVPVIIFGTYRALALQDELRAHGATAVTTRASELLELATKAVTAP